MSIRHYDHRHESVDEVRQCSRAYAREAEPTTDFRYVKTERPMSPKQEGFIKRLLEDRNTAEITDTIDRDRISDLHQGNRISSSEASHVIDSLLKCSKRSTSNGNGVSGGSGLKALFDAIPDGRYAVQLGIDEPLKFYRVATAQAGHRWIMVQASDELHKIGFEQKKLALSAIAKNPKAALLIYGQEIGRCGHCGRTLTNEESRSFGIGPVCRANGAAWGF
jgi:hypothetical protein